MGKVYKPEEVEKKWYKIWEEKKYFHSEVDPKKKPYCIVIPPPNVTGILHMGHALNQTVQDILIRWKRMKGDASLWLPGTDHAGIATQNVVERRLALDNKDRHSVGREAFIDEVWKWKEEHHNIISSQQKLLGNSCDWDRERFTMDEGLSHAVLEVFIRLYEKGLIYKGNYIINWCPRCQTALSDEEAQHKEMEGNLYYLKYPIKDSNEHVIIATTRPETMLGDTGLAINPKDERYANLKDKVVILPLVNRELRVVYDELVDPEFGTGVVKVTPAHDPNDFAMGMKHGLEFINVMNKDGTMNNEVPEEFFGLDRFEARETILDLLKQKGLLLKTETHTHAVGHCYRCHTVVEPYLSKQWFVKMKPLAKPAIKAAKDGKVTFYPDRWTKVYLNWLNNINDWCISRQIWWGHRIPVYYCNSCYDEANIKTGEATSGKIKGLIVAKTAPEKCPHCGGTDIVQDNDVLDTWFSSWLWPFSTLGWPQRTPELKYFYPTNTLVTAQDIIFFWVARMIMAGIEFLGKVPFNNVYIHGIVRDQSGAKMSKSLGNVIDPLEVIDEFGADALRFSIVSLTSVGQDVYLSKEKFEAGRNFANKLWNATRFILMNSTEISDLDISKRMKNVHLVDQWILSELSDLIETVDESLLKYRLNDAALAIYDFIWHKFCDWYLEFIKSDFTGENYERKEMVSHVALHVLEKAMRLLHPFMPFITEEIWHKIKERVKDERSFGESIMITKWPKSEKMVADKKISATINSVVDIISAIRNMRADFGIPITKECDVFLHVQHIAQVEQIAFLEEYIKNLAKVSTLEVSTDLKPIEKSTSAVLSGVTVYVPLSDLVDVSKEVERLSKKLKEQNSVLQGLSSRLSNKTFLQKAPKDVVAAQQKTQTDLQEKVAKLSELIQNLSH